MTTGLRTIFVLFVLVLGAMVMPVAAQDMEIAMYLGWQTARQSRASGDYPGGGSYSALIGWEGKSFEMPPYYGVRGTWWQDERFGLGLEFTHAKVYAPEDERRAIGFDSFELTDGLNIVTLNAMRRWKDQWQGLTPYVGGGLGLAIPHVDIETFGGDKTLGYQITGPAARLIAGASYDLNERFAVFGEYQFIYSSNKADLDGGGTFNSDVSTNALNVGLSLKF